MKGWIYIISNKAMTGLVKVGYSMKDPDLRAKELNHTGSPHPYCVEYCILVDNPQLIEQKIHKTLSKSREGKEWFKCTAEEAVVAIKKTLGNNPIFLEMNNRAEIEKVEKIIQQEKLKEYERQKREEIILEYEKYKKDIDDKYKRLLDAQRSFFTNIKRFWYIYLGLGIPVLLGTIVLFAFLYDLRFFGYRLILPAQIIISVVLGISAEIFLVKLVIERITEDDVEKLNMQYQDELETIKYKYFQCPTCMKDVRVNLQEIVSMGTSGASNPSRSFPYSSVIYGQLPESRCPNCKTLIM